MANVASIASQAATGASLQTLSHVRPEATPCVSSTTSRLSLRYRVAKCAKEASLSLRTPSLESRARKTGRLQVAAIQNNVTTAEDPSASSEQTTTYHFVIANARFMLDEEEHFQELMRERLRHFSEIKREQDFWLVYEPDFLESFPEIAKRLKRPAVALVSTDGVWMTYMKLRLDRVLRGEFEASSAADALASKPVDIEFQKPEQWVAPYPKYEGAWWTPFLPPQVSQN